MTVNNVNVPDVDAQRKRKANKLCIISLIFAVIVPAAVLLTAFVATYTNLNNAIDFDIGLGVIALLCSLSFIAGCVLMIIAKITCRKCIFATILMFVYIGLFVSVGALIIFYAAVCEPILSSC